MDSIFKLLAFSPSCGNLDRCLNGGLCLDTKHSKLSANNAVRAQHLHFSSSFSALCAVQFH